MELLMPGLGLIFWMTVAFGFVMLILKKYAWKPILNVLHQREIKLAQSFSDAKRIEQEMTQLEVRKQAKIEETDKLCQEMTARAKEEAVQIIEEAREKALAEAKLITDQADEMVQAYKRQAMEEVRSQLSALSLDIAEKILEEEFSDRDRNARYVDKLLTDMVMN
ncbi:MAG: F0F1 ATP synthase subunit B [Bacteroidales bacterium]|nr:F0F1 ATP synthase subunit B [Bacteroidales bacterium]